MDRFDTCVIVAARKTGPHTFEMDVDFADGKRSTRLCEYACGDEGHVECDALVESLNRHAGITAAEWDRLHGWPIYAVEKAAA